MGRIKTAHVKNLANDFLRAYPDKFTIDFDQNKDALASTKMSSKWLRNRLAGYLAKRMKQKARGIIITAPVKEEVQEEQT